MLSEEHTYGTYLIAELKMKLKIIVCIHRKAKNEVR